MENNEEKKLTKKQIKKSFWRWTFFSHSNYNYERMQASGFLYAMLPVLNNLYEGESEELKNSYTRHLEFFNTEPHFGGIIGGLTIAMEEQKANGAPITGDAINSIKTGLMGPLAGIGDTLWQATLVPILLSIAVSIGAEGNLFGPVFYIVAMFAIMLGIAYNLWLQGYNYGKEGIQKLMGGDLLKKVMLGAKIMGALIIGALTANYVELGTPFVFEYGDLELNIQEDILDQLLKGMLPLAVTMLSLYLLNKKVKSTSVLLVLIVISAVGAIFGIF
ncbi:PTS system mannose/fructose/sorbose family transporter subunit IID [Tetragenococcus halophilus]|uniref:PTS system mannose/fructose/sorbose family transporter subunit IID n=1 Tax=Tetragenococcus halophilus TaxID=51669 RepID=UPI001F34DBFA|nr:PTS system mannose/fructose/sorbose family transporter subunit IID [Tetragenococcus halophilus]MCF1684248.1 PTS system mannose/fructose/sorbose family transporter subunit IID [Tetragenococcus halophilus]